MKPEDISKKVEQALIDARLKGGIFDDDRMVGNLINGSVGCTLAILNTLTDFELIETVREAKL